MTAMEGSQESQADKPTRWDTASQKIRTASAAEAITIGGHLGPKTRYFHWDRHGSLFVHDYANLTDPWWGIRFGKESERQVIVGRTAAMLELFSIVERVAACGLPVLIQGESGTGKELIAAAIARVRGMPFLSRNCAAVPPELLDSELFGHVRGAFTGATTERKGWFEAAHGGTLFLDEIGDMPVTMQAKLLRVLEDGEIMPVGSNRSVRVDVRVVSATNQDLPSLVRQGKFRPELLVRLRGIRLSMAPLRVRKDDIPYLVAHHLLRSCSRFPRRVVLVPAETLRRLLSYDYPFNVRELFMVLDRALALGQGRVLRPDEIIFDMSGLDAHAPCSPPLRRPRGKTHGSAAKTRDSAVIDALRSGPHTTARLARLLDCSQRTVQRAVARLVAQGLVTREKDANDPQIIWCRTSGRQT